MGTSRRNENGLTPHQQRQLDTRNAAWESQLPSVIQRLYRVAEEFSISAIGQGSEYVKYLGLPQNLEDEMLLVGESHDWSQPITEALADVYLEYKLSLLGNTSRVAIYGTPQESDVFDRQANGFEVPSSTDTTSTGALRVDFRNVPRQLKPAILARRDARNQGLADRVRALLD